MHHKSQSFIYLKTKQKDAAESQMQIAYTHPLPHPPSPKPHWETNSKLSGTTVYLHTVRLNLSLRQWMRYGRPQQPSNFIFH